VQFLVTVSGSNCGTACRSTGAAYGKKFIDYRKMKCMWINVAVNG
jgi:hypothetical protein